MKQWQRYPAELFGTFILVFVGTTALVAANRIAGGQVSYAEIIVPFAFGLALLAALYAFAEVSGGHFNPAVSLGLYLDGRLSTSDLFGYWISQIAGGTLASAVMLLPFTRADVAATATVPNASIGDGGAFTVEIVMTAIFVSVILQSSKSSRYSGSALVAIPLTLLAIHFAAIPFSGASVNPARTLGPAIVGDRWDSEWIYMLGPAIGALIGFIVHSVVVKGETGFERKPEPHPEGSPPSS